MRLLAGLLAIVGTLWVLFLLLLLGVTVNDREMGFEWEFVFYDGSVVLVTIGYWARALTTPPLKVRYLIWGSAVVVQGVWLGKVFGATGSHRSPDSLDLMGLSWFGGTFIASVGALCLEHKVRNPK